jgi:hypothetical protein
VTIWAQIPSTRILGLPERKTDKGSTFRSFTGSLLLRPVRLLAPLCRSDQNSSGHRDFYFQAFDESVTLLAAGYNYDSYWTILSVEPLNLTGVQGTRFGGGREAKSEILFEGWRYLADFFDPNRR